MAAELTPEERRQIYEEEKAKNVSLPLDARPRNFWAPVILIGGILAILGTAYWSEHQISPPSKSPEFRKQAQSAYDAMVITYLMYQAWGAKMPHALGL